MEDETTSLVTKKIPVSLVSTSAQVESPKEVNRNQQKALKSVRLYDKYHILQLRHNIMHQLYKENSMSKREKYYLQFQYIQGRGISYPILSKSQQNAQNCN